MTAQVLLLVSAVPYVTNWGAFVLAGTASLAMFIAMRWITRTVTAEERRLIHSIASRLRMQHAPRAAPAMSPMDIARLAEQLSAGHGCRPRAHESAVSSVKQERVLGPRLWIQQKARRIRSRYHCRIASRFDP